MIAAAPRAAMAHAGVERAVGSDAAGLVQKLGQHGRVTNIAGGELGGEDLQCLLINFDMDLPPDAPPCLWAFHSPAP
jgi:hypothetical protein